MILSTQPFQQQTAANMAAKYNVIQHANTATNFARTNSFPIAHVKVGFSDNHKECPLNSPPFSQIKANNVLILSSPGCDFHKDINISADDIVIIKHRISAFHNTTLKQIIEARHINHLFICGVSTNMAVELTAREAHDMDHPVTVIENACAAANLAQHQAAIANLNRISTVITAADLMTTS